MIDNVRKALTRSIATSAVNSGEIRQKSFESAFMIRADALIVWSHVTTAKIDVDISSDPNSENAEAAGGFTL